MQNKKSAGLGDSVEKVLKATGIDKIAKKVLGEDCGCKERKEKLNKLFPYVRDMTLDEIKVYEHIMKTVNKGRIDKGQQTKLLRIYNALFKTKKEPSSCAGCVNGTIDKLTQIYEKSCKSNV